MFKFCRSMKPETFEVYTHSGFDVTPTCMEDGSVGFDIALPENAGPIILPHGARRAIDTGVVIKPPAKCFVMLVPRSSSRKKGIRFTNTVGIIDPSYCGPNDHLIIDLTRDEDKMHYLGRFPKNEIGGVDLNGEGGESLRQIIHERLGSFDVFEDGQPRWSFRYMDHLHCYPDEEGFFQVYFKASKPEKNPVVFEPGDRICQALFLPYYKPTLIEKALDFFGSNDRGGFGSTGA